MASCICALLFDSTSEEALVNNTYFDSNSVNSLSRLFARSLASWGQVNTFGFYTYMMDMLGVRSRGHGYFRFYFNQWQLKFYGFHWYASCGIALIVSLQVLSWTVAGCTIRQERGYGSSWDSYCRFVFFLLQYIAIII